MTYFYKNIYHVQYIYLLIYLTLIYTLYYKKLDYSRITLRRLNVNALAGHLGQRKHVKFATVIKASIQLEPTHNQMTIKSVLHYKSLSKLC